VTPGLAAALAGLALLDSINPSAIAITILLMTQPRFAARAAAYIGAVFATYLLLGVAILAGLDAAWAYLDSRAAYVAQAVLGGGLLAYALFAPERKPKEDKVAADTGSLARVALLGAGVTVAEFSTALPYLGAITLLADAKLPWAAAGSILVAYNAVFVLPPVLLTLAFLALGERVRPRLERLGAKLRAGARSAMLWLMGGAGFLLLSHALPMLGIDFGAIDLPGLP
jgi:cytochrome c biogenesis protein CcdA